VWDTTGKGSYVGKNELSYFAVAFVVRRCGGGLPSIPMVVRPKKKQKIRPMWEVRFLRFRVLRPCGVASSQEELSNPRHLAATMHFLLLPEASTLGGMVVYNAHIDPLS